MGQITQEQVYTYRTADGATQTRVADKWLVWLMRHRGHQHMHPGYYNEVVLHFMPMTATEKVLYELDTPRVDYVKVSECCTHCGSELSFEHVPVFNGGKTYSNHGFWVRS